MKLTPALREVLKKPLGALVKDATTIPRDADIVAVGDTASETLISAGYEPKLVVYDGLTRRRKVGVSKAISSYGGREYRVKNQAGHLDEEVLTLFQKLLAGKIKSRVFVEGEEDLTALAAISHARAGVLVVYGQPDEGLVVVRVDEKIKERVKKMLEEMEDGN